MKKTVIVLLIALLGGLFYSCQKETLTTNDPEKDLTLKGAPVKPTPTLTIDYNPAPANVGEEVTVSALVSYNNTELTCGQVQLFYAVDANGDPCSVANASSWVNAWGQPKDAPGGTATFTYNAAGYYGWRAQYESSGPDCDYGNLTGNDAVTFDLLVVDGCTDPLTITPILVSAKSDNGKLFTFKTQWKVKACEAFTNLKTQGGLTAGSTVVSTNPTASNIKTTKQNTIINWIQPTVNAGDEFVYEVVFTRELKNTCTTYDITGDWSAKAWHMVSYDAVYDEFGTLITPAKTVNEEYVAGYNNKIFYQTPCY